MKIFEKKIWKNDYKYFLAGLKGTKNKEVRVNQKITDSYFLGWRYKRVVEYI